MKGKVGSDYAYRANVQKIDTECLKWFLEEQKISVRGLAKKPEVTASEKTIRTWMKRGEMPAYLIEEICDALALETVCDMRENPELKCAEPVTTFRWRDREPDEDMVKLHARIGVEIQIPKKLFELVLRSSASENGNICDLTFNDDTAALFLAKGKPAWDHYIPSTWMIEDAIRAGFVEDENHVHEAIQKIAELDHEQAHAMVRKLFEERTEEERDLG